MPDKRFLDSLVLARGSLDRAAEHREDVAWLEAAWSDERTRVLLLHRGTAPVLVHSDGEPVDGTAELVLLPPSAVTSVDGVRVLLAVDEGIAFMALLLDADDEAPGVQGASWLGLREIGIRLPHRDAALFVTAVALGNWHGAHPRCPKCGVPTEPTQAGWSRTCPEDASMHFPRNDPAVIVLVIDADDRALLGRRVDWPGNLYSTLAGFVEAGESAEAAVLRELSEEAGVDVDPSALDYKGSQPWPFPSSLMLGYHARLAPGSRVAIPDGVEIAEVRWFTREEMAAQCAAGEVMIPGTISIARRLVENWYGEPMPEAWSRR